MQRRAGHTYDGRVVITVPARARVPPVLCNTCTHDAPRGWVGGDVLRAPKSHADRRGGGDADPRPIASCFSGVAERNGRADRTAVFDVSAGSGGAPESRDQSC